jgi:cytochrome b subunit of formate dehydrogenase
MSDLAAQGSRSFVVRFDRYHRVTHACLMASFLGLAGTGLPLLFADRGWAWVLSRFWGGFASARILHRAFALVLIATFIAHVARIGHRLIVKKDYGVLWGPDSMVPQPRDLSQMIQHVRWFIGLGPRPAFGHFTYWEKFDYWAVFWGMIIIGGSGLLLWFPTVFSRVVPGWVFNIAMLVHGEEALLAVGFIFTIHFFNGHLRPEKFPMDIVIFTGRMPRHELEHERREEFETLQATGRLDSVLAGPPSRLSVVGGRTIGTIALSIGVALVLLIVLATLD